ncbi:unnamed protein product, partial [Allacma fusca]
FVKSLEHLNFDMIIGRPVIHGFPVSYQISNIIFAPVGCRSLTWPTRFSNHDFDARFDSLHGIPDCKVEVPNPVSSGCGSLTRIRRAWVQVTVNEVRVFQDIYHDIVESTGLENKVTFFRADPYLQTFVVGSLFIIINHI